MEINTSELKNKITSLENLLNEYEEIKLNLFNQLKNSVINWQDGNSIQFDNAMYVEKQETEKIYESMLNKKKLFQTIYERYCDIGNKISCKLGNKNALIRTVDYCISYANSAISAFDGIDTSVAGSAIGLKSRIEGVKSELGNIRERLIQLFDKIEAAEVEIRAKVKELEDNHIPDFIFTLV